YAISGISKLTQALELSRRASPALQFKAALAVFNRQGDYVSLSDALVGLSQLRQLAITTGDAASLGALHVAVARTEGLRGFCTDACRHVDIARRIFRSSSTLIPTPWLDTIESSLEMVAGN